MNALLFAFLLVASSVVAMAEDGAATVKQEANKCAKAILDNDYEKIVLYTHPRIVKGLGGKEAMIGILKNGMAQMRGGGIEIVDVTIGNPEEPKKIGTWITSLVGQHLVMKGPGGKLQKDSTLLGISEDEGKHWVFVDLGPITQEQLGEVFPELADKIKIPAKKPSEMKKE